MKRKRILKKDPQYTAPDGTVHKWTTQKEFDEVVKSYTPDYDVLRNRKVGDATANDIFLQALDKFGENPQAFSPEQIQALKWAATSLGYIWQEETPKATTTQSETPPQQNTKPQDVAKQTPAPKNIYENLTSTGTATPQGTEKDKLQQWGRQALYQFML